MKVLSIIIVINVSMLVGFVSGSQKNTTEAFKWTSENEYDTAQLVTKRILYAFRLWILRLNECSTICSFITLAIGLAFFGFITNLMYKTNAKIHRKIRHYSNKQELDKKFKENSKNLGKIKDCKTEENSNLLSMKSKKNKLKYSGLDQV